ncbi:Flp family type IVb pilin [Nocardioides eburneiflavus]|jgi:pilus assembly protein Flp/PilA|uniref:Flp family type IVb pilin n=1 Tax=Nocardioides eburneiflavus TaxID=2518372 RepID=A0A4Z1CMX4_9ACTN|nr:Flp family type IVb pilin [Nocardioides eburneiflavus]TGN66179.1 Flp family type IVb pilin [Nocardioides eburneiflavus]
MLEKFVAFQLFMLADREEKGATAVEYGLMVALIAAIIVATVALLGQAILGAFQTVLAEVN